VFELRRRDTGGLVHAYASCFALEVRDELGHPRTLAEGLALVQRALEDRAE
jgi:hypothetical protein